MLIQTPTEPADLMQRQYSLGCPAPSRLPCPRRPGAERTSLSGSSGPRPAAKVARGSRRRGHRWPELTLPCGDEVCGGCTRLREFFEEQEQAYVLRVASNFTLVLAPGAKVTCAEAVKRLLRDKRWWEVRSAGRGSRGERRYAWAWIATASPRHHLL
jgi:hypothetical protein